LNRKRGSIFKASMPKTASKKVTIGCWRDDDVYDPSYDNHDEQGAANHQETIITIEY
jgi:hypothetical protein